MSDGKNLSDNLDDMLGDAKDGAQAAADKAGELAGDAKEKLTDLAGDAKDVAKDFSNNAKEVLSTGAENKKVLAGVLAILFGCFGVHKFILGYQKEGIIMLLVGLSGFLLCGTTTTLVGVIGLIEGIIYLTKSDKEFKTIYQEGKKAWF